MKNILLILMLVSFPAESGRVYLKLAIGVMIPDDNAGLPEISISSPSCKFALGYEFKATWLLEYEHVSSILHADKVVG